MAHLYTIVSKWIPIKIDLCSHWFFILLPPRSFLIEQLSQDVAEMLLVVQKEVDDDGTWLKPDDTKKWFNRTFALSLSLFQCGVIVKKKHWSDEQLYGEQHYRKMADSLTDTHTQREVRENDLVFKATCFLIWRSRLSEVTLTVCLWGDTTIAVQPRHYSLSLSLSFFLSPLRNYHLSLYLYLCTPLLK